RQSATSEARAHSRAEAREQLRVHVSEVLELSPSGEEDLAPAAVPQLLDTFNGVQLACQTIARLAHGDEESEELRRTAEKLSTLAMAAQRELAESEETHGVN